MRQALALALASLALSGCAAPPTAPPPSQASPPGPLVLEGCLFLEGAFVSREADLAPLLPPGYTPERPPGVADGAFLVVVGQRCALQGQETRELWVGIPAVPPADAPPADVDAHFIALAMVASEPGLAAWLRAQGAGPILAEGEVAFDPGPAGPLATGSAGAALGPGGLAMEVLTQGPSRAPRTSALRVLAVQDQAILGGFDGVLSDGEAVQDGQAVVQERGDPGPWPAPPGPGLGFRQVAGQQERTGLPQGTSGAMP